jgi:transketolase
MHADALGRKPMTSQSLRSRQAPIARHGHADDALCINTIRAVTVEQGSVISWERYAGDSGAIIGMHRFGASAPLKDLLVKFGFPPKK